MIPIYEQIIEQIKSSIIAGKLNEGDVLPSVRGLSGELRISALTVKKAYDFLENDGFISTIQGKGSYVNLLNQNIFEEEKRKEIEKDISSAIRKAHLYNFQKEDIKSLIDILWEEIK